jgi:alpha-1,2-glucosyltransferase
LSAFALSGFPLNYFFQFLYYTDTGSTLFFLMAYYSQLRSNYVLAALFGAISIIYRQTNVVWVAFCLLQLILTNVENVTKNQDLKPHQRASKQKHSNLFEFLIRTPSEIANNKEFIINKFLYKLYKEDFTCKKLIYSDLLKAFDMNLIRPYVIVILTFCFFVYANNGIVVGDRSNHEASFHLVQLFYFFTFACALTCSSYIFNYKKVKSLLNAMNRHLKIIIALVLPLFCLIVHNFTYEHPFLLSDNRHYTFYIWSKLYKRHHLVKYALTPIYLTAIYLFYRNLMQNGKTIGWLLAYTLCIIVGLVPQKLIEFRYFIIPFYVYRLNISVYSFKELLFELLLYILINSATIYIFLNKIFYWPNQQDEQQRFMW